MEAQDYAGHLKEFSPFTDAQIHDMKTKIKTNFIYEALLRYNADLKVKIAANQLKNVTAHEVPKTTADLVFETIIKKYGGKVVYVDFWATWCGPCRSGIERIKPLKEEMAAEDVVFLYITNHTSPISLYNNMIPEIKGEHFRVSSDEWNYLKSKFQISGIPHYVLVNKKGEVVEPDMNHPSNESLKKRLVEELNK